MQLNMMLPVAIFISLLTASSLTAAERVSFEKVQQCPVPGASNLKSVSISNQLQCSITCALRSRCNAFHFQPLTGLCFLGDSCDTVAQWTVGSCESYVYVRSHAACGDEISGTSALLSQLQMKLFFRFKKTGLVNEVNPRQFCLTGHDIAIGSDGAEFKGHSGSYLSTGTPGFENFLDYGKSYSFFARVRHVMDSGIQFYHRFQECLGNSYYGNSFGYSGSKIFNYAGWTARELQYRYAKSSAVLPSDGKRHLVSAGLTFNGEVQQSFYYNGSFAPTDMWSFGPAGSRPPERFQCLVLGRSPEEFKSLNGTMQCYGLSTRVLTGAEFLLLEDLCQ